MPLDQVAQLLEGRDHVGRKAFGGGCAINCAPAMPSNPGGDRAMDIAFVTTQGRGLIDDCLAEVVAHLQHRGVRLCGTVRALPVDHHAHPCDMDLRVLPDGPLYRISQSLGSGSKGCRLYGGAIETLATEVEARLPRARLLVVNKFGKQESLGRGLRPAIAKALDLGIPVLVGVNALNLPDFIAFTDGLAVQFAAKPAAVLAWASDLIAAREAVAV